jgi:type IV fimbrial biogenesis protein FimT
MKQGGFTLAELMMALALGSILLSVAVPSYTLFVQNSRQVTSANELLSSLHLARDLAITRNQRVTVCPTAAGADCEAVGWEQGWIVFVDTDGNGRVDGAESIDRAVGRMGPLSLSSVEFQVFMIYRPNGRVMVNNVQENVGEFTVCDERGSDHARVIVIDLSGRPRVSRFNADGGAPVCPA